jgi:MYXO-CTERM domain-containing protein
MNRDPLFHVNPDLPPVSNIHRALGTGQCQSDGTLRNISITLESGGDPIKIPGPVRLFSNPPVAWNYAAKEPFASRIELVSGFGEPAVYSVAQAKVADDYLNHEDPDAVRGRNIPIDGQPKSGGSGCSLAAGAGSGAAGLFLLVVGLLAGRRRRRRPTRW